MKRNVCVQQKRFVPVGLLLQHRYKTVCLLTFVLGARILSSGPESWAEAPPPAPITAQNGAMAYTSWVDGVWIKHLHHRADQALVAPFAAEAFLRDALRAEPSRADTVALLAEHYHRHGLAPMHACMQAYERLLKGVPVSTESGSPTRDWTADDEAQHQASAQKFAAGRTVEAEVDLRNLLHEHPRHPRLLLDLGLLYLQSSDWGMAAATLAYARACHPNDFDAANNLAISLDNAGRPDLVPAVLEQQLAHQPDDPYLIRNISQFAGAVGDHAKALEYARRWVALEPDNPEAQEAVRRLLAAGNEEAP